EKTPGCTTWHIMHSSVAPAHACPLLTRELQRELMDETARYGEPKAAGANCGNAPIGKSVEKWASDGGPCLPPRIAPIAAMSRPRAGIACRLAVGTLKSNSVTSTTVRIRSATKRESGALIRAGVVSTVRNN